ncbi:PadR family transcriptional regulator [Fusibacter ferrireducens]|uniref:PadR family transcriptional regulator n=1 Tax=Fusibacter ferrireducens TaxID=2785058 RepID=A0ABR9ZZK1_9FIRM|nr:PadR family transcriptional regulator [Fusibacter ferrireducens]MBF4695811.1 PadR family transcriptional regulator [Fusibacter ferrireducens]
MKVPFYILGLLLRYGPQHGYKLMQLIEERISDFAKIKLPTLYYHLQKLDEQAYISRSMDKEGNRPEKFIYTITEKGINYYDVLYNQMLEEEYSPEFAIDGVLFYSDQADQSVLFSKLEKKKNDLGIKIEQIKNHKITSMAHIDDQGQKCAELIFDHHICHLEAEYSWLNSVLKGLKI